MIFGLNIVEALARRRGALLCFGALGRRASHRARGVAARWLWRGGGARRAARCACICIDDLAGHWPSAASEGAGVLAARSAAG